MFFLWCDIKEVALRTHWTSLMKLWKMMMPDYCQSQFVQVLVKAGRRPGRGAASGRTCQPTTHQPETSLKCAHIMNLSISGILEEPEWVAIRQEGSDCPDRVVWIIILFPPAFYDTLHMLEVTSQLHLLSQTSCSDTNLLFWAGGLLWLITNQSRHREKW